MSVCTIRDVRESWVAFLALESPLKFLLAIMVAAVSAAPAFAFILPLPLPLPRPHPVPTPELAIGAPAVIAVICAYVLARLLVPAFAPQKARNS